MANNIAYDEQKGKNDIVNGKEERKNHIVYCEHRMTMNMIEKRGITGFSDHLEAFRLVKVFSHLI